MRTPGKPFNRTTKLGRLMADAGLRVADVEYATGINHRTLSDILAGRRGFSRKQLVAVCEVFECEPGDVEEDK